MRNTTKATENVIHENKFSGALFHFSFLFIYMLFGIFIFLKFSKVTFVWWLLSGGVNCLPLALDKILSGTVQTDQTKNEMAVQNSHYKLCNSTVVWKQTTATSNSGF